MLTAILKVHELVLAGHLVVFTTKTALSIYLFGDTGSTLLYAGESPMAIYEVILRYTTDETRFEYLDFYKAGNDDGG